MSISQQAYKRGYDQIEWKPRPPVERKPAAKSLRADLPCPATISDTLAAPLYSGADGKQYTSKSALRGSYLPGGNPDGIRYEEVGNEKISAAPAYKPDDKAIDASIMKAMSQLGHGA